MVIEWYPKVKGELDNLLNAYLEERTNIKKNIQGLIVPHAGYSYSGKLAGKAFSLLKRNKNKSAIIFSPSHYLEFKGILTHNQRFWQTPLGGTEIIKNDLTKKDIRREHAIDNQIPFLQKIGFKSILPVLVGEISLEEAKQIAGKFKNFKGIFIFSTDLSHFLSYDEAIIKDKQTIKAIESLSAEALSRTENSACGLYPLLILIELCKIKNLKPKLIDYYNSGDITGEKSSVVGYCSMVF